MSEVLLLYWCIVCGGSLLTIIHRIRRQGRVGDWWRCRCDHCGAALGLRESSLPLINYLWLHGRSRCCRRSIGWWHPLSEVAVGLALFAAWKAYLARL